VLQGLTQGAQELGRFAQAFRQIRIPGLAGAAQPGVHLSIKQIGSTYIIYLPRKAQYAVTLAPRPAALFDVT
jgi:hypothetical protein